MDRATLTMLTIIAANAMGQKEQTVKYVSISCGSVNRTCFIKKLEIK